jgi:hypothetical protein
MGGLWQDCGFETNNAMDSTPQSGENLVDDIPVYVGEAEVAARVTVGKAPRVETERLL